MKAIVQHAYGEPEDVLAFQDIDKPEIDVDDVRIRVQAASIHIGDCHLMRGIPYFVRLAFGVRAPKHEVPGVDFAGEVEAVGAEVTQHQPGDAVFGWARGVFAEYVCAPEKQVTPKPANLTFEQASCVGVSAMTALQALRDQAKVQPGQKVLINGASGGVGTFAVQIAKAFGAEVTGVCSARNAELVRSIGADHVIDYAQEDFTAGGPRYDLVLDNVANHSLSQCRRALTPDGTLLPVGGTPGRWLGGTDRIIGAMLLSPFVRQQGRPFISFPKHEDLVALKGLTESGEVTPVIDRTYPLSETATAMAYVGAGHARAKVVITA